jgi:Ni,Fe-hydrogenase III small subunit
VTPKEIVIACGDCAVPGVYFFDNELKVFAGGDYTIANPSGRKLQLSVHF